MEEISQNLSANEKGKFISEMRQDKHLKNVLLKFKYTIIQGRFQTADPFAKVKCIMTINNFAQQTSRQYFNSSQVRTLIANAVHQLIDKTMSQPGVSEKAKIDLGGIKCAAYATQIAALFHEIEEMKIKSGYRGQLIKLLEEFLQQNSASSTGIAGNEEDQEFYEKAIKEIGEVWAETLSHLIKGEALQPIVSFCQQQVNGMISSTIDKHLIHQSETLEKFKVGELNLAIGFKALETSNKVNREQHINFTKSTLDETECGTMMHARIAAEIYDVNIRFYQRNKKGELVLHSNIIPPSKSKGKVKKTLEIEHIPPDADHPNGHFKLRGGEESREVSPGTNNCLFETLSGGIAKSFQTHEEMTALDLRRKIATETLGNPKKYNELISRHEDLKCIGDFKAYILQGGAKKSPGMRDF